MKKLLLSGSIFGCVLLGCVQASTFEGDEALCASSIPPLASVEEEEPVSPILQNARDLYETKNFSDAYAAYLVLMNEAQENCGLSPQDHAEALTSYVMSTNGAAQPDETARLSHLMAKATPQAQAHAFFQLLLADEGHQHALIPSLFIDAYFSRQGSALALQETLELYEYDDVRTKHEAYQSIIAHMNRLNVFVEKNIYMEAICVAMQVLFGSHDVTRDQDERDRVFQNIEDTMRTYESIPGENDARFYKCRGTAFWQQYDTRGLVEALEGSIQDFHMWYGLLSQNEKKENKNEYIECITTSYAKLGNYQKVVEILEELPQDLNVWDVNQLQCAIKAHLSLRNAHHARPHIQILKERLKKRVELEKRQIQGKQLSQEESEEIELLHEDIYLNIEVAFKLAFSGFFKDAKAMLNICDTHFKSGNVPDFIKGKALAEINNIRLYMALQDAMSKTDVNARKNAFRKARATFGAVNVKGTTEEKLKYLSVYYISLMYEDSKDAQETRIFVKNVILTLQATQSATNASKSAAQPIKPSRKGAKARRQPKAHPLGTDDAIRSFLKAQYVNFTAENLQKMAEAEEVVRNSHSPALIEKHNTLKDDLKALSVLSNQGGIPDAKNMHTLVTLFHGIEANLAAYKTLVYDMKQEIDLARRSLAFQEAARSGELVASSSTDGPATSNERKFYSFEKSRSTSPEKSAKIKPSSSSSGVASSSAASSSTHAAAVSDVFITRSKLASKDLETLLTKPGMKEKYGTFLDEIRKDPFLVTMNFASGRAEALRVGPNIYSRRFDGKNRLVYEVKRGADGHVHVEILRALKHYKRQHLA
ncbi:MAG: hypothetical protein C0514_03870 [Candidatus Puniceispirillum sp.]|nr:hypothetical protein [Candidatus Puniceispirillum sp.]